MSADHRILIVLTSHAVLGATGQATGVWLEELATPYYAFADAGVAVDVASVDGGEVPVDPKSLAEEDRPASVARFLADATATAKIERATPLDRVSAQNYVAVFLPGGHGTMWDLPECETLARMLSSAWADGKVVGAVCHGPAGLVNAVDREGRPIVAGRRVTGFTDAEERAVGLMEVVPFLLESRLRGLGARFEDGPDFEAHAVRDGRLVTGQNPASSEQAARLVLEAIGAQ